MSRILSISSRFSNFLAYSCSQESFIVLYISVISCNVSSFISDFI